ncbi:MULTISPECIES: copper amine oxidase N-terminal domain-containing protein [unclassified Paenibacillus]|uniref:copper amine oxidase N-terminal domain-containing protein n=1 Tax=unclassified Paenibacillus TaxID=185978 RepID=UPI0012FE1368|nr:MULTISPECIES: copper amine oxidase N-terminal domain-containing protein [unclassified Paenibacillus]ASS65399.2 copper amine oxidase N-terminal domain-containing protein [Paenibacillus sp. RUD330]
MRESGWNKIRKASLFGLCLLMLTAAGCQAVGGLDMNGAIAKSFATQSSESRGSLMLSVDFSRFAYEDVSARNKQAMKLLENLQVRIDSWKLENEKRQSLDGAMLLGSRSIGFSAQVDEQQAVIRLEGLKKPLVIAMDEEDYSYGDSFSASAVGIGGSADPLQSALIGRELVDKAGGFWISKLPNPERLSVLPVSAAVYGGGQASWKVTTEWQGMELWGWLKKYVTELASDRSGLNESMSALYDVMLAHPELGAADDNGEPLSAAGKEELVANAVESISDGLASGLDSMDQAEEEGDLEKLFTKGSSLKAELLLDSSLHIRSLKAAAVWQPEQATVEREKLPINGISLVIQREQWRIDEEVAADKPDAGKDSWTSDRWADAPSFRIMQDFDKGSAAYEILKNELQAGRQRAMFYPFGPDSFILTASGQSLVPLRSVAERMGGTVAYDSSKKKWSLQDPATGKTAWFQKDSRSIQISGKSSELSYPASVVRGSLYVPARDIARFLGASISVEKESYTQYVALEREVG